MANFSYLNSQSYICYKRYKAVMGFWFLLTKILSAGFGMVSLFAIYLSYLKIYTLNSEILGLLYILFSFCLVVLLLIFFFKEKLIQPIVAQELKKVIQGPQSKDNLTDYLDQDSNLLFGRAYDLAIKKGLKRIDTSILVVVLAKIPVGRWIFTRMQLAIGERIEDQIINTMKSPNQADSSRLQFSENFNKLITTAALLAVKNQREKIEITDIILALAQCDEIVKKILVSLKLEYDDLVEIVGWYKEMKKSVDHLPFWERKYYGEGIGREWASGYTPTLNLYSADLSKYITDLNIGYQSAGRQQYIEEMERVLAKSGKNNVLLIGEPGIGKKNVVYGFTQKVARGLTVESLHYKHVIKLDIERILAGDKSNMEAMFLRVLDEAARAGNVVLFIDGFSNMIKGEAGQVGTIDATEILVPYLNSSKIQIIALSNYEDYQDKIATNSAIDSLFTKIKVEEPKGEDLLRISEYALSNIEANSRVFFTYQSVKTLIKLCDRYIHNQPFPEKAIGIAQEVVMEATNQGKSIITPNIIEKIIGEKAKIPVGEAKAEEKEKLLNLEQFLHQRVIGQEEAIDQIANALRRSRAGLKQSGKPVGSFLFIGPTGVGKTETAKALAEAYFGSENNMIRFDMSEFQELKTIDRLIGDTGARREATSQGRLTRAVRDNPYTLILFDELEKAHPNILNLFLQMLDEGKLTDAAGRVVDFCNAIIIATSNAGAEQIREYLQEGVKVEELKKIILDYLQKQGIFRPEFLNRFDGVVCFKPLTLDQITQVVVLMLGKLNKTLEEKKIKLEFVPEAIQKLAKEGYDPIFGARPMRRIIQEKVENVLAKKMLSGMIQQGQTVKIGLEDI